MALDIERLKKIVLAPIDKFLVGRQPLYVEDHEPISALSIEELGVIIHFKALRIRHANLFSDDGIQHARDDANDLINYCAVFIQSVDDYFASKLQPGYETAK